MAAVTICSDFEAQGLVEVYLSVILDLFDSNQFLLCPWAMPFF